MGAVASVVGAILTFYFYRASLRDPDLVYSVRENRPVIVQKDRPSGLEVNFDGTVIDKADVVVTDVAIWNAGRGSIRPGNILEPVFIELGDGARVLTAKTLKSARRLSNLKLTAEPGGGRVGVTWSILEQNDGLLVQLIYAGSADAPIRVAGVIEHQGPARLLGPMNTDAASWMTLLLGVCYAAIGVAPLVFVAWWWVRHARGRGPLRVADCLRVLVISAVGIGMLVVAGWFLNRYFSAPRPPFGQ